MKLHRHLCKYFFCLLICWVTQNYDAHILCYTYFTDSLVIVLCKDYGTSINEEKLWILVHFFVYDLFEYLCICTLRTSVLIMMVIWRLTFNKNKYLLLNYIEGCYYISLMKTNYNKHCCIDARILFLSIILLQKFKKPRDDMLVFLISSFLNYLNISTCENQNHFNVQEAWCTHIFQVNELIQKIYF